MLQFQTYLTALIIAIFVFYVRPPTSENCRFFVNWGIGNKIVAAIYTYLHLFHVHHLILDKTKPRRNLNIYIWFKRPPSLFDRLECKFYFRYTTTRYFILYTSRLDSWWLSLQEQRRLMYCEMLVVYIKVDAKIAYRERM